MSSQAELVPVIKFLDALGFSNTSRCWPGVKSPKIEETGDEDFLTFFAALREVSPIMLRFTG